MDLDFSRVGIYAAIATISIVILYKIGYSKPRIEKGKRAKVVVLGGGYAGSKAAKILDSDFDVTLVERQNYFTHKIGFLRGVCNKDFAPLALIPFDKLLKDGVVKRGDVLAVTDNTVSIKRPDGSTESINFEYLIVATGVSWTFPSQASSTDAREAVAEMEACCDAVKASTSVVCIGGGSVGVELACEIKNLYPDKTVTIVHSGEELVCSGLSDKFKNNLTAKMAKLGVVTILKDKLVTPPELVAAAATGKTFYAGPSITVKTAADRELKADLVFRCTGTGPRTGHLGFLAAKGLVDAAGRIKVNDFLQAEGLERVFAIGDCCATAEQKIAFLAEQHAVVAAANVAAHQAGRALKRYKPEKANGAFIPIGDKDGAAQIKGFNLPTWLVVMLKSRDLGASRVWPALGYNLKGASPPLSKALRDSPATTRALQLA